MPEQHVLVVEDNPSYQTFMRELLRSDDFAVSFTSTLQAARETCEKTAFDLILLDLSLPDGDGLKLFADLRMRPKNKSTPVLFLTANSTLTNKIAAFALGADDYIAKDVEPLEIRSKVEAKLRNLKATATGSLQLMRGSLVMDLASYRAYARGET